MEPYDRAFNAAVMKMASLVCPAGYDVSDNPYVALPPLDAQIYFDRISETHRITVWSGASDRTIFGCPEHNWAFRAWHEWTHYILHADFSLDGELAVAHRQCADLARVFGHGPQVEKWQRLIMAEVYGQAAYYARTGEFPADQVAFDLDYIGATPPGTPGRRDYRFAVRASRNGKVRASRYVR